MAKKLTTEEFIAQAKKIHGDLYSYSLVKYINSRTKIDIVCLKHGKFSQIPNKHISGSGCSKCKYEQTAFKHSKDKNKFLEQANIVHKNKYNYSKTTYKNNKTKIIINCSEHGEFKQRPDKHLQGQGCIKCSGLKRKTTEEFISQAKKTHNDYYKYTETIYENCMRKIKIICPEHGVFEQAPGKHLIGQGCYICNKSKGENKIESILKHLNIKHESQKTFKNCINPKTKRKLKFDFYIPHLNLCLEYDGQQHFREFSKFGGKKQLLETQYRDEIKNYFCEQNEVNLERINYKDYENLEFKIKYILTFYNSMMSPKFD